jgi:hypothetical protein
MLLGQTGQGTLMELDPTLTFGMGHKDILASRVDILGTGHEDTGLCGCRLGISKSLTYISHRPFFCIGSDSYHQCESMIFGCECYE